MTQSLARQRYVLTHAHSQGAASNIFDYQPTEQSPVPNILAVAELLGLELDKTRDELELIPITDEWVEGLFFASEAGAKELQMFLGPKQFAEFDGQD